MGCEKINNNKLRVDVEWCLRGKEETSTGESRLSTEEEREKTARKFTQKMENFVLVFDLIFFSQIRELHRARAGSLLPALLTLSKKIFC